MVILGTDLTHTLMIDLIIEPVHEISNNVVCASFAQSDQSLCWSPEYSMIVKLLTEHHRSF